MARVGNENHPPNQQHNQNGIKHEERVQEPGAYEGSEQQVVREPPFPVGLM